MASIKKDKKTNKWYCRVPYKDENGKYRTKTRKGFETKKEAELVAAELKIKLDQGIDLDQPLGEPSFAEYFLDWAETYKLGKGLSHSTEKNYLITYKKLKETFKKKPLSKVTRRDYQKFINKRGINRSKSTVEKTHYQVKAAMSDALHEGLIKKDPTYKAVLNYDIKETNDVKYWSLVEFRKLANVFRGSVTLNNCMLYIQLLTGLRIGEVYGLSWNDINLDDNTLSVNRGYDYTINEFTRGKNKPSIRTIIINDELSLYIKKYKMKFKKSHPDYPFLDKRQHPSITHTGISKYLKKTCIALGIEPLTTHALRHTHCSVLIFEGVDINYISKRLGHSTTVETMRTYSHIIEEMKQKENEKVIEVLDQLRVQN